MNVDDGHELYLLRQESKFHEKGIRSLCVLNHTYKSGDEKIVTAGYDGLVIVWKRQANDEEQPPSSSSSSSPTGLYEPELMFTDHVGVVYCVCDGGIGPGDIPTFFSGGQDKKIFWVTTQGKPLQALTGHNGVVNCVTLSRIDQKKVLLSGSWDTTAKVWDVDTGMCLHTLSNHKYAVSVFSWARPSHSSDLIITGSQDGTLHIWDFDINQLSAPIKSFPGYHLDIIRGFGLLETSSDTASSVLLSCSNDGTFKSVDLSNDKFLKTVHASDTFLFDIASFHQSTTGQSLVYTASEDGKVGVWNFSSTQNVQMIPHGSTVWKIGMLPNGDLLSGCEDGTLRIWTTDESNAAPLEQREKQKRDALKAHQVAEQQSSGSSVNVNNLPDVSQLSALRGTKAGQHKLFRDGDRALVYIWNGHAWEYVDEVASQQRSEAGGSLMGKYFEGDDYFAPGEYDYIFDAEIADDGKKRAIPFRVGDNTLVVAERFCAREGISKAHVPQIEQFIKQNTTRAVSKAPTTQPSQSPPPVVASAPPTSSLLSSPKKSQHFPPLSFLTFKGYHADKLKQKLLEFNDQLTDDSLKLTDLEKSYLDAMVDRLNQSHLASENFRLCEMDLTFNSHLSSWPPSKMFPVIDLWRIMVLHPQSTDLHKKSDAGWHYIALALKLSKIETDGQPQLALCCMRYLCNLFEHPTNRNAVLKYASQILESLPEFPIDKATRQARLAETSMLVNLCVALGQSGHAITLETAENVLRSLIHRLQTETDEGVRYYLFVATGTLLSYLSPTNRIAASELCHMLNLQLEGNSTDELRACQHDVATLLQF